MPFRKHVHKNSSCAIGLALYYAAKASLGGDGINPSRSDRPEEKGLLSEELNLNGHTKK